MGGVTWIEGPDGRWDGGRVRLDKDGHPQWVIERMRNGRRYSVALDVDSLGAAKVELDRFLWDPEAYKTKSVTVAEAQAEHEAGSVFITKESIQGFLDYLAGRDPADTEPVPRSVRYRKNVAVYLEAWRTKLEGRDLRTLKVTDYNTALTKFGTARKHRIIALKSFCTWLRRRGKLDREKDATLDLVVPAPRSHRAFEERAYPIDLIERLYRQIKSVPVRDVILVRAKTALHFTEIDRLARGEGEVVPLKGQGEIAGVAVVQHKSGKIHTVATDAQTLAAMLRLQARGRAPVSSLVYKRLKTAGARVAQNAGRTGAAAEPISPGRLRHSFATWALTSGRKVEPKRKGLDTSDVAAALGHAPGSDTMRKFYAGYVIPPMVVLPIKLLHPDDAPLKKKGLKRHPLAAAFGG